MNDEPLSLNAFRKFRLRLTVAVPEGQTIIAQRFNAGFVATPGQVPEGRLKCGSVQIFNRPFGTCTAATLFPALKRRAIVTVSLRDRDRLQFPKGIRLSPDIS